MIVKLMWMTSLAKPTRAKGGSQCNQKQGTAALSLVNKLSLFHSAAPE
jgi:hypothetical protein